MGQDGLGLRTESESLNKVSEEDLVGGGAEVWRTDVGSVQRLSMPLVGCCVSFAARQRKTRDCNNKPEQDI